VIELYCHELTFEDNTRVQLDSDGRATDLCEEAGRVTRRRSATVLHDQTRLLFESKVDLCLRQAKLDRGLLL